MMTRSNPPRHRKATERNWKRRTAVTTGAVTLTTGLVITAPNAFASTPTSNVHHSQHKSRHAATPVNASAATTAAHSVASAGVAADSAAGNTNDSTTASSSGGGSWVSGAYLGGLASAQTAKDFGAWRGQDLGAVMTYPVDGSWDQMANSQWNISTFKGFNGKLIVSVPLLPQSGGDLQSVANGDHDAVFRKMAQDLIDNGRGDAVLRIGWEANGKWFKWGNDESSAATFKAAFRHVASVMKSVAPNAKTEFGITCGQALEGSSDRMASLNDLYPGDDSVDIVGCSNYDMWSLSSTSATQWNEALTPRQGPGLSDVVQFASAHGKQWSVPEWGVVSTDHNGNGDDPFYVQQMKAFFAAHSSNLAYESYFNDQGLTNSQIWPNSAYSQSAGAYHR